MRKNQCAIDVRKKAETKAVSRAVLFLKLMRQSERDIQKGRVAKHKDVMRKLEEKFNS